MQGLGHPFDTLFILLQLLLFLVILLLLDFFELINLELLDLLLVLASHRLQLTH